MGVHALPGAVAIAPPRAIRSAAATPISPIAAALLASSDYRAMLDKLDTMTSAPIAERLFYKALILDTCAGYREVPNDVEIQAAVDQNALEALEMRRTSRLKDEGQKAAMRYKIERNVANVCRGFGKGAIPKADIDRAFADAAAAGDPKARARLVAQRLVDSANANAEPVPENLKGMGLTRSGIPDPLTPAERATLLDALFTGDPIAIPMVGEILSANARGQFLRIGAEEVDLGVRYQEVWALVACDFGFECGERNMYVNISCADMARCSPDYESYLHDYTLPAADLAFVEAQARTIADAIRRRDYSAFRFSEQGGQFRSILMTPPRIRVR
jgi:hypothetical protein